MQIDLTGRIAEDRVDADAPPAGDLGPRRAGGGAHPLLGRWHALPLLGGAQLPALTVSIGVAVFLVRVSTPRI